MDCRQQDVTFDTGHSVNTEPPLNKYTEESAVKTNDLRRYDLIITQDGLGFGNAPPQEIHANIHTFNPMMLRQSVAEPEIVARKAGGHQRVTSDSAPQSVASHQTHNKDSTADFPVPTTDAEVIDLKPPNTGYSWYKEKNDQSRRGKSQDLTATAMQMHLSNAFQASDVVKKELNQNMQFLLELKQKAAQQEEFNMRLRWENENLKDKVMQYQKIIDEPTTNEDTQDIKPEEEAASPFYSMKKSQKDDAMSNDSGHGACTVHPQLHKFEFETKKKDEEQQY